MPGKTPEGFKRGAPGIAHEPERHTPHVINEIIVLTIGVHAVIGSDAQGIACGQPTGKMEGKQSVGFADGLPVSRAPAAGKVPGIVDVHAVDKHDIRNAAAAERFSVVEQFRVRIVVTLIEQSAAYGQCLIKGETIPPGIKRSTVAEFTEPVIGGSRRDESCVMGLMKKCRHRTEAGIIIVE